MNKRILKLCLLPLILGLICHLGHADPLSAEKKKGAEGRKGLTLLAIKDFKKLDEGEVPYYIDNARKALAINAAKKSHRDKWAQVSFEFKKEGVYDVMLTTLTEEDGECIYELLVNGKQAGVFKNPRVKKEKDSKPLMHVWKKIKLGSGDKISLRSKAHSNGIIPENDEFAWARGRWRQLKFVETAE